MPDHVRQQACWPGISGLAGVGGFYPRADPLETVRARLDLVRGRMQFLVHEPAEVRPWLTILAVTHGYSCSRAARRAVMPRAV